MFAFTGLALALGGSLASVVGVAAVTADVAMVGLAAYSAYAEGRAKQDSAKAESDMQRMQAEQYRMQAEAQSLAAADSARLADVEGQKAGIAQMQAEQEAEKRSRMLASDIGSVYANYAGNGLLVDAGGNDTFANVLKTTVAEAQRDVSTIRDNGRMSVWEHQSNARSLMTTAQTQSLSAESSLVGAQSSLIGAQSSLRNSKYYGRAKWLNAVSAGVNAAGSAVSSGLSGASYARGA